MKVFIKFIKFILCLALVCMSSGVWLIWAVLVMILKWIMKHADKIYIIRRM